MSLATVILISGRGSNMQRIVENTLKGQLDISIKAVISNEAQAAGLQYAVQQDITTHVIPHTDYDSREAFDQDLQIAIDRYSPQLVVLAGFMRILTKKFVEHYLGRMINIHPSLLPKYPGLNTHKRALQAQDSIHGASVHYVTPEVDGGPVIIQAQVPIKADDTEQSLAQRVLSKEHIIFSQAIQWIASGELKFSQGRAILETRTLPVILEWE